MFILNFEYIKSSLKIILRELLSLIYNDNCIVCHKPSKEGTLCKNCAKTVEILPAFAHKKIKGVEIFSATIYGNIVKTLIHNLKFKHNRSCARVLANILNNYYASLLDYEIIKNGSTERFENAIIVPVPTHKININKRGYNNVFEIAKLFTLKNNLSLNNRILSKIKHTEPMYKIKAANRKTNVRGTFSVNKEFYNNETVVIIDDITTTGATLCEIIDEFKKAGIDKLICVTLSKAV